MKREELVSRIENYMNVQKEYQESVRNAKGRKRFAVLDFFANNFGGRMFSGAVFGIVGLLAAAPLGIFALIPMAAACVLGFFAPKLAEKITLKLMTKFGNKYSKQYLGNKAEDMYAYHLICQKKLWNAKNADEISNKDLQNFCKDVKLNHDSYDRKLQEVLLDKIDKRNNKDYGKIVKILAKENFQNENTQQKVEKILAKNEEVLKPWYELNKECGEFASKLADCAKEFNPDMKAVNKKVYFADEKELRTAVNNYIEENNIKPVEFDTSKLFEDEDKKQRLTNYASKTKEKENEEVEEYSKKMYN